MRRAWRSRPQKSALGGREAAGRGGREARDQRIDLGIERLVVDGAPDQPPLLGLRGLERAACQGEAERARLADGARQVPGAPGIRDEADGGERLHETRAALGEHDVAGERDVDASAGRDAVDGAHHRQRQR